MPSTRFPEHARFAQMLLRSLAGEGKLQGQPDLSVPSARGTLQDDFYIEDVYTRVPADRALIERRLRSAVPGTAHNVRVLESASFSWTDEEFRVRFEHVLKLEPLHTLLVVNGVLSYEDAKSASRTPLWGSLAFFRSARQRDMAYLRHRQSRAQRLIKKATDMILAIHRGAVNPPAILPLLPEPRRAAPSKRYRIS
ncbi:hypothetical protein GCM10008101_27940 [Lysobacter xinjiangensis]|uniref:Uncharacterized protein n=1 Tax=Cognatilysobacter xinjiangensis TaxID=546892 RepID=A0ABQ3C7U7_9GAMM|nr:hypothetical protein [Lysobacter xinjiangensis]GGZ72111.1 hypothetical protein GCM10008101_27940 [Lysobacter xinjiangensis]